MSTIKSLASRAIILMSSMTALALFWDAGAKRWFG